MSDQLEKFILQNRDQFNDLEPDPKIWEGVILRENKKAAQSWIGIAWKVAAAIIIFIGSYFFHDYMNRPDVVSEQYGMETSEELEMLMDAEAYYTSQINATESQIFQLAENNPELIKEIRQEMEDLDERYKILKEDLNDNVSSEEIIEAMIQNYRMKLLILEEVLHQLKKSKSNGDEKKIKL